MQKGKQVTEEMDLLSTVKTLCLSYEEISVMKMQKIKNLVLSTRSFFDKLSEVYFDAKNSYKETILKKMHKGADKKIDERKKTRDSVSILLSANTKLHGGIINDVFGLFSDFIASEDTDIIIVGRLGRELYQKLTPGEGGGKNYLYFEIPDMEVTLADLKSIVYHLLGYEKINVFYGQYNSMMQQVAKVANITGDEVSTVAEKPKEMKYYIFEPTLEKILHFFETQIFSALFKQTVHEGQLARFASRIKAMEQALDRIEINQGHLISLRRKIMRLHENKNQLERIAGMALWRGQL